MNELRHCVYYVYGYEVAGAATVRLSAILAEGSSPTSGTIVEYNSALIDQATHVKVSVAASSAVGGINTADALLGVSVISRGNTANLGTADRHMDIIGPVDVVGNTSFESEFSHSLDVAMTVAGGTSDPILVNIQVFA